MAKNYNYIMEDWLAECKKRYSTDTMEKALSEGRVAIRTFPLNATANFNPDQKSKTGGQGLEAFAGKLQNPSLHHQSSSFSILPSKLFLAERGRVGVLVTLPFQEDIKEYQNLIKIEDVDRNLKNQVKDYLTRVTYFDKEDMLSHHEKNSKKHYRPDFDYNDKEELKNKASKYQSFAKDSKFHNLENHNEALVKVRESSKLCLVAFNEKDLYSLLQTNAKEVLPNAEKVKYALLEPETNIVKFVDERQYHKTSKIEFTHEVNAFDAKPKSLAVKEAEGRLEASVKHISSPAKAEEAPSFHLPPIIQKPTLTAGNMKEERGHRLQDENHLPRLKASKTDCSNNRYDSNAHNSKRDVLQHIYQK